MRQEIPIVVLGADGRPVAGASVYVRTDPGGADATIYQGKTGGATHPNPRTSDAQGRVEGWLDRNDYAATISGVPGLPPWVEYFPIAPAADGSIDGLWLPDDVITARHIADAAISAPMLVDDSIIARHLSDGIVGRAHLDPAALLPPVIAGKLNANGTIATSSPAGGFTASHPSTGTYNIAVSAALTAAGFSIKSAIAQACVTASAVVCEISNPTTNSFTITVFAPNTITVSDQPVTLVMVG